MRRTKSLKSYNVKMSVDSHEETVQVTETSKRKAIDSARSVAGTRTVLKVSRNRK
jgi:hypothetical protein